MNKYIISILTAGFFWGLNGVFCRVLISGGFSSNQVAQVRFIGALILFGIVTFLTDKHQFYVKKKDLWCFIGSGIFSLLVFTICYFQAMTVLSLSAAAILLYTAPIIIAVLSRVVFKEKFTRNKLLALVFCFTGCVLVCGIGNLSFSLNGIFLGLGAGLGYALYSIFCRLAYDRGYKSNTVNFYSCLIASIGCASIWGVDGIFALTISSQTNFIVTLCCGSLGCFVPYFLYSYGITVVNISKASILASMELITATILGVIIYKETLNFYSFVGILLIICAIITLNTKKTQQ